MHIIIDLLPHFKTQQANKATLTERLLDRED
jgi:hypothetical protein